MIRIFAFAAGTFFVAVTALADPCADLVRKAETGLKMQGLDTATRQTLEELLRDGQSGDVSRCTKSARNMFQSSPEGEKAPAKNLCSNPETTV
jgi:hypothetical protein